MTQTSILNLDLWQQNQNQFRALINQNFEILEFAAAGKILSRIATPPTSPVEGDAHILLANATGAWAGQPVNQIALFLNNAWFFIEPVEGLKVWDAVINRYIVYNGTQWEQLRSGAEPQTEPYDTTAGRGLIVGAFGLGAQILQTPPGNDCNNCRVTAHYRVLANVANKPATENTGTLVHYGTNPWSHQLFFSENQNTFFLRRLNGTTWQPWLRIFLGHITAADIPDGSITTNKIANTAVTDVKIAPNTISLSRLAGSAIAGASGLFEWGFNSNGQFMRFRDGTLMCWHVQQTETLIMNHGSGTFANPWHAYVNWTFPIAFSGAYVFNVNAFVPTNFAYGPRSALTVAGPLRKNAWAVNDICVYKMSSDPTNEFLFVELFAIGRWQ
ncbi:MAG: hypothetical protein DDT26_00112 [Dehalococcoidia bacterium]|nr:hypothetical protein [Chloroflexota bacterium]